MTRVPSVNDDIVEKYYVGFAAFSILIWDHVDTFTTEVEYIWKREKGIVAYLFFLNRYLTPLGFIVNLFAYLSPVWIHQHFIRFEGAMTLIGIHVVGIMMLLRINALYSTNRILVAFVFALWLVMFCVNAWLLTRGQPVMHNPQSGVRACTMIFPPQLSIIASSSAWLPLLYDSVILLLTLTKTLPLLKKGSGTYMIKRLVEDGLIYYTAIFSVTLVLTIMICYSPPGQDTFHLCISFLILPAGLKNIAAHLKKFAHKRLECSLLNAGTIIFQSNSLPASGQTRMETEGYRNPDW
ncbi:hypothetical protein C8R45DRAFT_1020853 [Mycena sanguinolenta]|nr:hypothetical protein C8R45DRAFT_1020853 [Mycena sanguinolenta]